ncbi:MAG: T9SS type A sorting domain-containing protein [Bacteroidota bacterium]
MKKRIFLLFVLFFVGLTTSFSQAITWQKSIGGSSHEYTCKSIPTSDGGMAFVGFSESTDGDVSGNHGGADLWVGKISSAGVIQWSYLYGGSADDQGYDILQTADGGFMVAGWTDSNDGDVTGHHGTSGSDFWVLKLTSLGAITWSKCYGGTYDDDAKAIAITQSGDFYISGTTYSTDGDVSGNHGTSTDFWVIKINSTGTLLGQKCVGGTNYEEGINMSITADDGCILCGRSSSTDGDAVGAHGSSDMLIAKLNSSLVVEWSKCYGGTETEECNSIVQLNDGSYVALGYTSTQNNGDVAGHHGSQGSDDFWLLKLTSTGAITWAKCYGGSGDDQANGLTKTSDGGFVMCGLTNSTDGDVTGFHAAFFDPDVWVTKLNSSGIIQWQRCCGGTGQDESFNVFEVGVGIYAVTAFSYSNDYDVSGNHGSADGWIFKITGSNSIEDNNNTTNFSIFPNVTNDKIFIKDNFPRSTESIINVFDINGKIVFIGKHNNETTIDVSSFKKGSYIIRIQSNNDIFSKKIIVL